MNQVSSNLFPPFQYFFYLGFRVLIWWIWSASDFLLFSGRFPLFYWFSFLFISQLRVSVGMVDSKEYPSQGLLVLRKKSGPFWCMVRKNGNLSHAFSSLFCLDSNLGIFGLLPCWGFTCFFYCSEFLLLKVDVGLKSLIVLSLRYQFLSVHSLSL